MNDSFYVSEKAGLAWGNGDGGMQLYHPKFGDFCLPVPFKKEMEIENLGDAAQVGYAEALDFALAHLDAHNKALEESEAAGADSGAGDMEDLDKELARLEQSMPADMAKALEEAESRL